MKQAKYLMIAALTVLMVSFGNAPVSGASDTGNMPPATALVQDRDDKMLVNHNYIYDTELFIPGDTSTDQGFYIDNPGKD